MEIAEFNKCKQQMELEISKATHLAVEAFKTKTRYSPHSICINMIETPTIGEPNSVFMVANCKTFVEI